MEFLMIFPPFLFLNIKIQWMIKKTLSRATEEKGSKGKFQIPRAFTCGPSGKPIS
jgi:hypothetical protein